MKRLILCAAAVSLFGCSGASEDNPIIIVSSTNNQSTDVGFEETSVSCGNGTVDENEFCDDGEENGGPGLCNADCSGVELCGNGELDEGETCDGNLQKSCGDLGFESGTTNCVSCQLDFLSCVGERQLPSIVDPLIEISNDQRWALSGGYSVHLGTFELVQHTNAFNSFDVWNLNNGFLYVQYDTDEVWIAEYGVPGQTSLGVLAPGTDPIEERSDGLEFNVEEGGESFVVHVSPDGQISKLMIPGETRGRFSDDLGSAIYFDREQGTYVWISSDGRTKSIDGSDPQFSSSRRHVLWEIGSAEYLMDMRNGDLKFVTRGTVRFSNGAKFVIVRERRNCPAGEEVTTFLNLETSDSHTLDCELRTGRSVYFSDDDRYAISIVNRSHPSGTTDLVIRNTTTWTWGLLPDLLAYGRFYFNGENVLFHAKRQDSDRVFVLNLSTVTLTEIAGRYHEFVATPFDDGWIRRARTSTRAFASRMDVITPDGVSRLLATSEESVYETPNQAFVIKESETSLTLVETRTGRSSAIVADEPRVEGLSNGWLFYSTRDQLGTVMRRIRL